MGPVLHEPGLVGSDVGAVTVTVVGTGVAQRLALFGAGVATARSARARTDRAEMRENMFVVSFNMRRELVDCGMRKYLLCFSRLYTFYLCHAFIFDI